MATLRITSADRDERGFVAVEPRPLADLPGLGSVQANVAQPVQLPPRQQMIAAGIVVLLLIGFAFYLLGRGPAPVAAPAPIPTMVRLAPTAPATAAPVRLLIAFAAPDGMALGAIESTRAMTATGRYGDGWVQADVAGSGLVWVRASDAPGLAVGGLPDLRPRATAAPAAPAYVAPAPTDPPPPCERVGVAGNMVEKCGWEGAAALRAAAQTEWAAANNVQVVTVTTATPYR